jgi:hypothetical protein
MPRKIEFWRIAALAALGVLFGRAPASAVECGPYGCSGVTVVQPVPYKYDHHQYLSHGPDHDYTPMVIYDGHGGYSEGQWIWGGLTWRYGQPRYYRPTRD